MIGVLCHSLKSGSVVLLIILICTSICSCAIRRFLKDNLGVAKAEPEAEFGFKS